MCDLKGYTSDYKSFELEYYECRNGFFVLRYPFFFPLCIVCRRGDPQLKVWNMVRIAIHMKIHALTGQKFFISLYIITFMITSRVAAANQHQGVLLLFFGDVAHYANRQLLESC